jgi:hypothetical protein
MKSMNIMSTTLVESQPLKEEFGSSGPSFVFDYNTRQPPTKKYEKDPEIEVVLEFGDGEEIIATCTDLEGVIAHGKAENIMSRLYTAISEMLEVRGESNKNFIPRLVLKFQSD